MFISRLFSAYSDAARKKRARLVRTLFPLDEHSRVLDLGSERGDLIQAVLSGSPVLPQNVTIADIDESLLRQGEERYGFGGVIIPQTGRLPFPDGHFDLVHCSSVIEHVTVPKEEVWQIGSGAEFRRLADMRQAEFAMEIRRLGKSYFVQTPHRFFPVESHSWLPFLSYLPRCLQLRVLRLSNRYWVKKTRPDWHLLTRSDMKRLFPDAEVLCERSFGLVKSLMAVRVAPETCDQRLTSVKSSSHSKP